MLSDLDRVRSVLVGQFTTLKQQLARIISRYVAFQKKLRHLQCFVRTESI